MDFVQSKFDVINIADINVIVDAANLHVSALKNDLSLITFWLSLPYLYKYGKLYQKVIRLRSFFKALTWRLAASTITFISAMFVTSNLDWTKSIVIFEIMNGILIFYIHERVWNKIQWGRVKLWISY